MPSLLRAARLFHLGDDYHLMNVAQALRNEAVSKALGTQIFPAHSLPPYDLFEASATTGRLDALLQFDLLGFQMWRDVRTSCSASGA